MSRRQPSSISVLYELTQTIDHSLDLLSEFHNQSETLPEATMDPIGLLEKCILLCSQYTHAHPEPIRTIHHLACTGGTLICKCLAALPNTQLLSEIDPLSTLIDQQRPHFAPTDMITLMRQSTRGVSQQLQIELFLDNLAVVYRDVLHKGQYLILRDHAHSHFCTGASIIDRPTFRNLVSSRFPVLSVITARHPLDSYLSLIKNGWVHFAPPTLEEYCKRYLEFLGSYETVPILKYESFVEDPQQVMRHLSQLLELPFTEDFIDLFNVFSLSGDSGRSSNLIDKRPRHPIDDSLQEEIANASSYHQLLQRLEYAQ